YVCPRPISACSERVSNRRLLHCRGWCNLLYFFKEGLGMMRFASHRTSHRTASHRTRPALYRFSPQLEALEDRSCPSCTATLVGTTLTILGDSAANTIDISDNGTTISVVCDGGMAQPFDNVTDIV